MLAKLGAVVALPLDRRPLISHSRPPARPQRRAAGSAVAPQFIFTMQDVRKVHPPAKEVLKGLWLSFYPGAKIGVLGVNGSGKSTLLRIMAGVDKDYSGEAKAADGTRVGYLAQEPRLAPGKTV